MAPAPSSQSPVVAETSPQEAGSPPPPLTPPPRRRRRRWRQRLSLPLRHLHPGLFPGRRRWRGGGTVVVDARPCLREGEFPPRRRGRPRLQPLNSAAQGRLCAPQMCAMADRVEGRSPSAPLTTRRSWKGAPRPSGGARRGERRLSTPRRLRIEGAERWPGRSRPGTVRERVAGLMRKFRDEERESRRRASVETSFGCHSTSGKVGTEAEVESGLRREAGSTPRG